jgi:hypothetical protein
MPQSIDEVRVGVDGVVSSAPTGTAAPTAVDSVLASPWVDLGYVSEDGVTESNTTTSEKVRAWQNAAVVRTLVTEGETTFSFNLIQTNADTLAEYYGLETGDIDTADGSFVSSPTRQRPNRSYVIDVVDGDELIRKYIKVGQITEVGDQVFQNGAPIGYEVTITAYDDATLGGSVKHFYSSLVVIP